ncbi:iron-sulfur cluster assembly scaffold protein [Patescibacteria group bacterium]|nr:iron-sulfur cluster assembly scaffold protein [Patescibacteria group bacterium]
MGDVNNKKVSWVYSDIVKDHFMNPRNFVAGEGPEWEYNGVGEVGSPACGDVMRIWIKVEGQKSNGKITKIGWKTFGCASAIASTSILSEMVLKDGGMSTDEAKRIKAKDIVQVLGGLPKKKIHCSVLGDQALIKAIKNYELGIENNE